MSQAGLTITAHLGRDQQLADRRCRHCAAPVICAENGSERMAARIVMIRDELLHDAMTLLGSMALIGRMERQSGASSG